MITTTFSKDQTLLRIEDKSVNVNNSDLKVLNPLIEAYNANPSEAGLNAILAEIDNIQDINRYEYKLGELIKFYVNKNLFYFSDDTANRFPISEDVVALLELVAESGGNIAPLVANIKLLRRNVYYDEDFLNDYIAVLLKSFTDEKIYNSFVDKGFYSEFAYIQSKKPVFTLTSEGLIVAYKKASFKDYKFDTQTGEIIPRYPTTYDEETGDPIVEYPAYAEGYKIYFDSGKTTSMKTLTEANKYLSIGKVVDQRTGKPGFEDEESVLAFKGTKITDEELYVKVLIHPQFIKRVDDRYNKIMSSVFLPIEFSKAPSTAEVKTKTILKYADSDWKESLEKAKKAVKEATLQAEEIIASQERM